MIYDNEKTSYIDIYFYDSFLWNPNFKRLRFNSLDTLSDILDKCLRFSLIKIKSTHYQFINEMSMENFELVGLQQ